jgi:hypothetical protein
MGLRPTDDGERKRGDTPASYRTAAERIQQACPLFRCPPDPVLQGSAHAPAAHQW